MANAHPSNTGIEKAPKDASQVLNLRSRQEIIGCYKDNFGVSLSLLDFSRCGQLTFGKVNVNFKKSGSSSKPGADRGPRGKPLLCPYLHNSRERPTPAREEAENG